MYFETAHLRCCKRDDCFCIRFDCVCMHRNTRANLIDSLLMLCNFLGVCVERGNKMRFLGSRSTLI